MSDVKQRARKLPEGVIALIRTMDVSNAAVEMANKLGLNAEVRTVVGKWNDRGQITGWSKQRKTRGRANVLVEVFVSDLVGADREATWAADEIARLQSELAEARQKIEALSPEQRAQELLTEESIFSFLSRKYVQRADARQQTWGLTYMEAETHDLARELERYIEAALSPEQGVRDAAINLLRAVDNAAGGTWVGATKEANELRAALKEPGAA